MIQLNNVTLKFGKRTLFEDVNIKFTAGNCYGLIGANGAGKSTFLKLLSGELETTHGDIIVTKGERIAVLKQDHYKYDNERVIDTVIMGNTKLYSIMKEKEELYSHTEFTDEDGIRLGNLEAEFAELNGWEAESEASELLNNLGVELDLHYALMKDIPNNKKVKVLLAQALFGNPDILLLDEPTNNLDLDAIEWLEEFLINFNNTVIVVSHDRHFLNKVCTHIADIYDADDVITTEDFIRTITTKQDRHPNSGNIYFKSGVEGKGNFRYLTPRECLLFMGFTDEDYDKLQANNPDQRVKSKLFPRDKIIRMAGNSIPVKMLEGFFYQLYYTESIMEKY